MPSSPNFISSSLVAALFLLATAVTLLRGLRFEGTLSMPGVVPGDDFPVVAESTNGEGLVPVASKALVSGDEAKRALLLLLGGIEEGSEILLSYS